MQEIISSLLKGANSVDGENVWKSVLIISQNKRLIAIITDVAPDQWLHPSPQKMFKPFLLCVCVRVRARVCVYPG